MRCVAKDCKRPGNGPSDGLCYAEDEADDRGENELVAGPARLHSLVFEVLVMLKRASINIRRVCIRHWLLKLQLKRFFHGSIAV